MKNLKKNLKEVGKSLNQLARQIEQMTKEVEMVEKAKAPKSLKAKAKTSPKSISKKRPKKGMKASAAQTILALIKRSKKGINNVTLEKKTGFNNQKIRDNIYRLKRRGEIKTIERGIHLAS